MIQRFIQSQLMNVTLGQTLTTLRRAQSHGPREQVLIYEDHLRGVDDLSQRPHQSAVDPHQLLSADLVGLVQHHAHLVLVVLQSSDHLGELVGDVQLVGVEQEDDAVHALRKPLQHGSKVVPWEKRTETGGLTFRKAVTACMHFFCILSQVIKQNKLAL